MTEYEKCKKIALKINSYLAKGFLLMDKNGEMYQKPAKFVFNKEKQSIVLRVKRSEKHVMNLIFCGKDGRGEPKLSNFQKLKLFTPVNFINI